MRYAREICLTANEMPAGVKGFISFHVERSKIFHNVRPHIISRFAIAKHFIIFITIFAKEKGQRVQKHSLSFVHNSLCGSRLG